MDAACSIVLDCLVWLSAQTLTVPHLFRESPCAARQRRVAQLRAAYMCGERPLRSEESDVDVHAVSGGQSDESAGGWCQQQVLGPWGMAAGIVLDVCAPHYDGGCRPGVPLRGLAGPPLTSANRTC